MKRLVPLMSVLTMLAAYVPASDLDCGRIRAELELPKKLKTKGKPRMGVVKDVDWTLHNLEKELQGHECTFKFGEVFEMKEEDDLFPLTNRAISIVPEDALKGLTILTREGDVLGTYEGRVRYERSGNLYAKDSYTIYYFQYQDPNGQYQSVGKSLLLDSFGVRWSDLQERVAVSVK